MRLRLAKTPGVLEQPGSEPFVCQSTYLPEMGRAMKVYVQGVSYWLLQVAVHTL